MRAFLTFLLCTAICAGTAQAAPHEGSAPDYVIEDNDFLGPGGSDIQSVIPLLNRPDLNLLGFTVVMGDGWENAESAHIRRFLEIAQHREVPVADGATLPLVNSVAATRVHEKAFGLIPWKGAWGGKGSINAIPDTQPDPQPSPDGEPHLAADPTPAPLFLIRAVHAHPHQVTIVTTGPLTNIALAIRMDPTFAATAKQLIFMGGLVDQNMISITGSANFASDFNMITDPEAAHIVITAPWDAITCVGNVSNDIMMTQAYMDRIAGKKTPVTTYLRKFYNQTPMWDELTTAIAADPSLITRSITAYMDFNTATGMDYGHAHLWSDSTAPRGMGLRKVRLVLAVDTKRFLDDFLQQAQNAMGTH